MKRKLASILCVLLSISFISTSAAEITIRDKQIIASDIEKDSTLITALYKNGVLASSKIHQGIGTVTAEPENDFGVIDDTDIVKAFIWNMVTLVPMCDAVSVSGAELENETADNTVTITANGQKFNAILEDNAAAEAFKEKLPIEISMSELNGNEKYYYFTDTFPANSIRPGTIHEGDLMLYGSSCLVLFYETFSSGYSYTRIGHIENTDGLKSALGSGSVTIKYE